MTCPPIDECAFAHGAHPTNAAQAGHTATERQRLKSTEAAARSSETLRALHAQLEKAGARYQDVQQLRAYIADLCDMLQVWCRVEGEGRWLRMALNGLWVVFHY